MQQRRILRASSALFLGGAALLVGCSKEPLSVENTNQPDVARGTQQREVVDAINAELGRRLLLDDFRVCYHDDDSRCECRKPAAGLLLSAADELNLDLDRSFMIGDRWRDVEAGRRAGCRTVFIDRDYHESLSATPDARVRSMAEAAAWILAASVFPRSY